MSTETDIKSFIMKGDNLQLIPFLHSETELFHELNTHPVMRKYLWNDELISVDFVSKLLLKNENQFLQKRFGLWKIILSDTKLVAGYSGLWYFFKESHPQLVYALLPEFTGKGIATNASRLVIHYAFQELGYEYIMASTDEDNSASQKVAKRLGMKLTEKSIKNGKYILFYELRRQDWRLSI